jgi:hypothetical protein
MRVCLHLLQGFFSTDLFLPSVEPSLKQLESVKMYADEEDFRDTFIVEETVQGEMEVDSSSLYLKSEENANPEILSIEKLVQMSLSQVCKFLPCHFTKSKSFFS